MISVSHVYYINIQDRENHEYHGKGFDTKFSATAMEDAVQFFNQSLSKLKEGYIEFWDYIYVERYGSETERHEVMLARTQIGFM